MEGHRWYATSFMQPPLREKVHVEWNGVQFIALRCVHPKGKKHVWATFRGGELIYLPPKAFSRKWGENPDIWRPLDERLWEYDLPDPIVSMKPVAWRSPKPEPAVESVDDHWWKDATQVAYSPLGQISAHEAEGRLMRSICTGWAIRKDGPGLPTNANVVSRMAAREGTGDYVEYDPDKRESAVKDWRPPFEPNGRDFDDYLVASAWFTGLSPVQLRHKSWRVGSLNRNQQILSARAMDPPVSWVFLGEKYGVSDERVRQLYKGAIDKITLIANGKQPFRYIKKLQDPLADLRERNRAYALTR